MLRPIVFNDEICKGCNQCVEVCLMEILQPNPEKGKPPQVVYPEECAYDGACFIHCPLRDKGAIKVVLPLPMRVSILRGKDR